MTRDEFNAGVTAQTYEGLLADLHRYEALRRIAASGAFKRQDVVDILDTVITALTAAMLAASKLGTTPEVVS